MSQKPLLAASNLSKTYLLGNIKVKALQDVSIVISSGDMLCITGKSGSGKSTLLRQLGLIDTPEKGTIMLNGRLVGDMSEKQRAKQRLANLGYIFQEYALIGELTAQENVALPALMLASPDNQSSPLQRASELLNQVGLSTRLNHRPSELSGGQQQRVAIARALINHPQVIFADEPTANLDSAAAANIMRILQKLNQLQGVTVVFVSHDPDDLKYANRVITMKDGKISKQVAV